MLQGLQTMRDWLQTDKTPHRWARDGGGGLIGHTRLMEFEVKTQASPFHQLDLGSKFKPTCNIAWA